MNNRFGGFGGGGNNMQALMRQAQKMQEEALKAQKEVEETELDGSASGGLVKVKINGNKELLEIKIDPSVVDGDDVEMLEDLIVAAFADATKKADALKSQKLGAFGGMM